MLLLVLFFIFLVDAEKNQLENGECQKVLLDAGATKQFPIHVYHAIHAITVQDLKIFEPTANENNSVPTINKDKKSPNRLLLNAPDISSANGAQFKTDAMKMLDLVLSDMDEKRYYQYEYSVLEEIVHMAHMREFWFSVLNEYNQLKKSIKTEDKLCKCVLDIENNGILDIFRTAANSSYGIEKEHTPLCEDTLRYRKLDGHVNYCAKPLRNKRSILGVCNKKTTRNKRHEQVLKIGHCKEPTEDELKLLGTNAWLLYVKRLPCLEKDLFEPALYLYCALRPN